MGSLRGDKFPVFIPGYQLLGMLGDRFQTVRKMIWRGQDWMTPYSASKSKMI